MHTRVHYSRPCAEVPLAGFLRSISYASHRLLDNRCQLSDESSCKILSEVWASAAMHTSFRMSAKSGAAPSSSLLRLLSVGP